MESLSCDTNETPENDETLIVEANFEPQGQSIWVSIRRHVGALFIYLIYWLTIWGAFTRVVGATLSSDDASEQVENGVINSVREYGWGNHYIWFLIVLCLVSYCCGLLSGATAKKRGGVLAGIAHLPIVFCLSFFCVWLCMPQSKLDISRTWIVVLALGIFGSLFLCVLGGSAGQRLQNSSFGGNTILGIRPIHWWWLMFPVNVAIQVFVPRMIAALRLFAASTFLKETKQSTMLFVGFVALATFAYFIVWGWYKAFALLSVARSPQFGKGGIALRVLLLLFGIPILGELVCVLTLLLIVGLF